MPRSASAIDAQRDLITRCRWDSRHIVSHSRGVRRITATRSQRSVIVESSPT